MKTALFALIIALLPAGAMAQDWSGFYGAFGVSTNQSEAYTNGNPSPSRDKAGRQTNVALGYNVQRGNWVFGGEVSYASGQLTQDIFPESNYLDGMLDLKGRAGFASGKLLWYGTIGWAKSGRYFASPAVTNEPVSADGLMYGVGVDLQMTDRVFAGVEYQRRNLNIGAGDITGFPAEAIEYKTESVALRVGIRF